MSWGKKGGEARRHECRAALGPQPQYTPVSGDDWLLCRYEHTSLIVLMTASHVGNARNDNVIRDTTWIGCSLAIHKDIPS